MENRRTCKRCGRKGPVEGFRVVRQLQRHQEYRRHICIMCERQDMRRYNAKRRPPTGIARAIQKLVATRNSYRSRMKRLASKIAEIDAELVRLRHQHITAKRSTSLPLSNQSPDRSPRHRPT